MASISQPLNQSDSAGRFARFVRTHPILLFFVLTYLIGWGMVVLRLLFWLGIIRSNAPNWWVAASFWAPCMAALLVQWMSDRNFKVCRLYQGFGKFVLGLVVGSLLVLVCNVVVAGVVAEKGQLRNLNWSVFFSLSSYRLGYSGLIATIGEEIGWRGFALPRLQRRFGPVAASVLVGLMWAGFMLPAFAIVQFWNVAQILMYAIAMVALSVEMTFAVNLSGLSVIVAITMHFLAQAESLTRSFVAHPPSGWEWRTSISNLLVPVILVLVTRGRLASKTYADDAGSTRAD